MVQYHISFPPLLTRLSSTWSLSSQPISSLLPGKYLKRQTGADECVCIP